MSQHAKMSSEPTTPPRLCSAAARRMRAHRERRRAGLRCVNIQLRETEVAVLIQKKLLTPDARNDTRAIRDALHAYLDRTLSKAL
jgi:hypothetical protein